MRKALVALAVLITAIVLFVEGLWALDFAMWYRHFHVYYPWAWGVCYGCKGGLPLGDGVNIKYFQICIALLLACLSTYIIGAEVGRKHVVGIS